MAESTGLPRFKYHPNPEATGSIVASQAVCECCGLIRGYVYRGPMYCLDKAENLCPWCVADGTAHLKWNAEFTDAAGVGGYGEWCSVPHSVIEEVAYRTVGFYACQQEQWWTHCSDAAEFLGFEGDFALFRCLVCGERGGYRDLD